MYLLNDKNNIQKVHVLGQVFLTPFSYRAGVLIFNATR